MYVYVAMPQWLTVPETLSTVRTDILQLTQHSTQSQVF